ncbi:hypothetical protein CBR_g50437 [Chara braunii]|uniref:Uncharacterized protein n=1 Tax=Chara braunii TaxID=69332 RepID=A0A388M703_CHABU|nr:hypothetical protein CBR_g50437 [Chara braunii]|eukprot:GBG90259.1 hypothetical protein CBR_g50437 [Chara braunii]
MGRETVTSYESRPHKKSSLGEMCDVLGAGRTGRQSGTDQGSCRGHGCLLRTLGRICHSRSEYKSARQGITTWFSRRPSRLRRL